MATKPLKDYLAVISVGSAGSWARGNDRDKAIKDVVRIFRSDFKSFYEMKKGATIKIDLLDVTGHDDIWWDARGYSVGDKPLQCPIERITHTF